MAFAKIFPFFQSLFSSSALRHFGESFSVSLDMSKAFDRAWHKALISKLPFFGIHPSLCDLLSDFLSSRHIAAVVDDHRSSFKSINSCVSQGSVLSPTLFLPFINNHLSISLHLLSTPMQMTPPFITPFNLNGTPPNSS